MLDAQDTRRECLTVVAGEHRHRPLRDDRPPIVLLVHEVHRHAADGHAGRQHGIVHPRPI